MNKTTLEQWRMLDAVVRYGGFAQAAAAIHKSQSTINHAVHKLQNQLGLPLLEVVGRKAQLTEAGALMLRRAQRVLAPASDMEQVAASLAAGDEAEIRIAVDEVFPPAYLVNALETLSARYPNTRVQLQETVLSGGPELLRAGDVDLLIAGEIPQGFLGDPLARVAFMAVARHDHPLLQQPAPLNLQDLAPYRQIVVRDSSREQDTDSGWLGAEQRWTVSHVTTSLDMISRGMGFAWLPAPRVQAALDAGVLAALPLEKGARRYAQLYLTHADTDRAGPATRYLAQLLHETCLKNADSFDF